MKHLGALVPPIQVIPPGHCISHNNQHGYAGQPTVGELQMSGLLPNSCLRHGAEKRPRIADAIEHAKFVVFVWIGVRDRMKDGMGLCKGVFGTSREVK